MHSVEELTAAGLAAFDAVVSGRRIQAATRPAAVGEAIARAFAAATLGEMLDVPERAIALLPSPHRRRQGPRPFPALRARVRARGLRGQEKGV